MKNKIICILIALFAGFLGGVLGYSFFRSYINNYSNNIAFLREYDLSNLNNNTPLVISGAKNVVVQQDAKRKETIANSLKSIAGIYRQKKTSAIIPNDVLAEAYGKSDSLASGVIITNDGWVLAHGLPTDFTLANTKNFNIICPDQRIYGIKNIVKSSIEDFVYIKIDTDNKDFTPGMFLPNSSDILGSEGLIINWKREINSALFIDSGNPPNTVLSSDNITKEYKISSTQDISLVDSPVFNLAGELAGYLSSPDNVLSVNFLGTEIADLLKNGVISSPKLGLFYQDLTDFYWPNGKSEKGIIIAKNSQGLALVKNGVAEKAGLKTGDVIFSVDNIELDKKVKFNELINTYSPNDKISLGYSRQGVKNKVDVILK
jgi:serine protease Do